MPVAAVEPATEEAPPEAEPRASPPEEPTPAAPPAAPRPARVASSIPARAPQAASVAPPAPAATPPAAFLLGADAEGVGTARGAGWTPDLAQVWAGAWVREDGWGHVEWQLRQLRDAGVTPQVQWYYWGADISPAAIQNGAKGKSVAEWDRLATELAKRIRSTMGTKTTYVVLETEFNKNGIESWSGFNEPLKRQIGIFRSNAPEVKLVLGFGGWKEDRHSLFKPAALACDLVGFQVMRGGTRDGVEEIRATPAEVREQLAALRPFGKAILLFDLALATHGGWEAEQEAAIREIAKAVPSLRDAGLAGIVLRNVRDDADAPTWEFYGAAERTFGLKTATGAAKPAWDDWLALTRTA